VFKVIVGLGNPGSKYDGTRHNIGFSVVDALVRVAKLPADVGEAERSAAGASLAAMDGVFDRAGWLDRGAMLEAPVRIGDQDLVVVKPRTFMNRSGEPLRKLLAFKKIPITQVIVVHDEIDLPVGVLRVKIGGGEGGHNGLRSISALCGGKDYARVRVGVGKPPAGAPMFSGEDGIARWVLARYAADERPVVEGLIARSAAAVVSLALDGLGPTQNRFNR